MLREVPGRPGTALAAIAMATLALCMGAQEAGAFFPEPDWAVAVGETDIDADEVDGISIDPDDNTVVSGIFRGEVVFGTKTFQSAGEGDIFLASLAPDGSLNWAKRFGGAGEDNTFDLKTDGAGNIVASGWYTGDVDFGGITLKSQGATDMFVAKFDQRGRTIWANSYGGAGGDGGNELDVLSNGEIAISAISDGDFKLGSQTFPYGGGGRDAYAIRLDGNGRLRWVHAFNGPGLERIRAMDLNRDREVSVGFQYRGSVTLAGTTLSSFGEWDGAAARLSSSGDPQWIIPVGGTGVDNVRGIASGPDGSIYASGVYEGPAQLAGRQVSSIGNQGDDFLARISSDGVAKWVVTVGGPGPGTGGEIRSDSHGVVMSSVASREVTVYREGIAGAVLEPPGGSPTSYLAAFDTAGSLRFTYLPQAVGAASGALGDVLSISPDGLHIAQVIRFSGILQAGATTLVTPSEKDSAVVFLRTDVADKPAGKARLRIRSISPKRPTVRGANPRSLRVVIRNTGTARAKKVQVCPKLKARVKRKIRVSGCSGLGAIAPGKSKRARLRIAVKSDPGSRVRFRIRVTSQNAAVASARVSVKTRH